MEVNQSLKNVQIGSWDTNQNKTRPSRVSVGTRTRTKQDQIMSLGSKPMLGKK